MSSHCILSTMRIIPFLLIGSCIASAQSVYYVAPTGSDVTGNGSLTSPWASLSKAVAAVPDDGSTVLVQDGTYTGKTVITRSFSKPITFRSQNAYRAKLRNANDVVVMFYYTRNIELTGFDIARSNPSTTAPIAVKIAGSQNLVIRNNIIHESYANDLLKINESSRNILILGNVFRNQQGTSGQHIDVNGCVDVKIRENIFFNDAAAVSISSSSINQTHGFIVVKNSGAVSESRRTQISNNVFLNFQGGSGSNVILLGEDGLASYEAQEITIENNLILGNSSVPMRAPLGLKGARNILFRNNTVVGNLPSSAFAIRSNREGSNPVNRDITLVNNIWSDPTGTMTGFSDGLPSESSNLALDNNVYWNGGQPMPSDGDVLNTFMDVHGLNANPLLASQAGIVLPNWQGTQFASGTDTIREEFERLVRMYGKPAAGSPVIRRGNPDSSPEADILDVPRGAAPDVGAVQAAGTAGLRVVLFRTRLTGGISTDLNYIFLPVTTGGTVLLSSSNPALASVPASVIASPGSDAVRFAISTKAVAAPTPVVIRATQGSAVYTATLTLVPQGVSSVNLLSAALPAGESTHLVMLEDPAPSPMTLRLSSSRPDLVSFPNGATAAAGNSYVTMTVRSQPTAVPTDVSITAVYGATQASAEIFVQTSGPTLAGNTVDSSTVIGPATVGGTVKLSGPAPTGGAVIGLSATPSAAVKVPATITIPAGASSANFNVVTSSVGASTPAQITATYAGVAKTAFLMVQPESSGPRPAWIYFEPSAKGGQQLTLTVSLESAAPTGGASLQLSASRPDLVALPVLVATAGSTRVNSTMALARVAAPQTVVISVTSGGVTKSKTLTINP